MSLLSIVIKFSLGLDTNAKGNCVNKQRGGNANRDTKFLCHLKHRDQLQAKVKIEG